VNSGIRRKQRLLIDALENRTVRWTETGQCIDEQILLPVPERTNAVDEYESSNGVLVPLGHEHREASTPRVPQDVPLREAKGLADGGEIAGVVLDAGAARTRWRLGRTSAALIVQDQLPMVSERGKGGPQQIVIEEQPAVYADKRNGAGFLRREKHGKVEPACVNDAPN
jgi:hypothetical protein